MKSPNDTIRIRPAIIEDAEALGNLRVMSWRRAYSGLIEQTYLENLSVEHNVAQFKTQLSGTSQTQHLVAVINNQVSGWSCSTVLDPASLAAPITGELNALYVLPNAWGKSLGFKLWQGTLERLIDHGCIRVTAWVLEHNERAERFYERQGFERQPEQKPTQLTATQTLVENLYALELTR